MKLFIETVLMLKVMQKLHEKNLCFLLIIHDHEKYIFLQSAALARTVLNVEMYVVTVVTIIGVIT